MRLHQEAGHYLERVTDLIRANNQCASLRMCRYISSGHQPDHEMIAKIGYLMRTTAVYGNGKFGIADRDIIKGYDGPMNAFRAEMLTVF